MSLKSLLAIVHILQVTSFAFSSSIPLSSYAQSLLSQSMAWMDNYYDPSVGYIYSTSQAALRHETRASAWYASGLLARNEGNDAQEANKIIRSVIGGQFKDPAQQWYATYQKYPEEPSVGTDAYPAKIYNSWDPNWRGFVGTTFIVILEEFPTLIEPEVEALIIESLRVATIGDSYRVGGVDDDNLYPSYSNPAIMRAFVSGWTGRKINDQNMTHAGEEDAKAIVDLFNRDNTLSEFNSGTYAGVSLFALTLWAKYIDSDSLMGQNGARMIEHTWESIGSLYNAQLKNVAGPWDRSYGFDMNKYLSILALHIWSLVGQEAAPVTSKPFVMSHAADFSISPLIAILSSFHNALVPDSVISALTTPPSSHIVHTSAFSPPWDTYQRNITSYITPNLTIGATSFAEEVVGGPSKNSASFSPAVAQWARDDGSVGWLSWYAEQTVLEAEVQEGWMELQFPRGNSSGRFSFLVGTGNTRDVRGWEDVDGISIRADGNVQLKSVTFNGANGGSGNTVNDFEFWNFTYTLPANSTEIPRIRLDFEKI